MKQATNGIRQVNVRITPEKKREFHRACFDMDVGMQHFLEASIDRLIALHKKRLTRPEESQTKVLVNKARTIAEQSVHG